MNDLVNTLLTQKWESETVVKVIKIACASAIVIVAIVIVGVVIIMLEYRDKISSALIQLSGLFKKNRNKKMR